MSVFADKFLISLRSDWTLTNKANTTFTLGSLLAVDINDLINNRDEAAFDVLFQVGLGLGLGLRFKIQGSFSLCCCYLTSFGVVH